MITRSSSSEDDGFIVEPRDVRIVIHESCGKVVPAIACKDEGQTQRDNDVTVRVKHSLETYHEAMEKALQNHKDAATSLDNKSNPKIIAALKSNMKTLNALRKQLDRTLIDLRHLETLGSDEYKSAGTTLMGKTKGVGKLSVLLVHWIIQSEPTTFTFVNHGKSECYYCQEFFEWRGGQGL